ncbi:hypothetical protein [Alicyclobacillus suci]|uniref:hypothetical protein n=1 Tax=Alicyclobacillus suci TaxID=2816080 RepID=UPI00166256B9|nr:hypothetical protein [Alicyclobacillus suci]
MAKGVGRAKVKRGGNLSGSKSTKPIRSTVDDAVLAKGQSPNRRPPARKKTGAARKAKGRANGNARPGSQAVGPSTKKQSLSQLLSPKNVQETMKTVGNLRGMVKNWLGYLEQADKMLDTIFVTTNSLKESGVLDKLVKHRGKNLNTEDFTSILAALMSSPLAGGFFKGDDGDANESTTQPAASPQQTAQPSAPQPPHPQSLPPGTPQRPQI